MAAAPGEASAGARAGFRSGFRRDIQGLRAVAILAVVGYHAGVPGMGGGYVGVDVFFVISGFLITGLIHDEVARSGSLSFAGFYSRRARRLLPSAILVIVATVAASAAVLSPLRAAAVLRDGVASALYSANYRFAAEATNYLSPSNAASPFLHFWSLGVEEQFYLIWPALLVLAVLVLRRRPSATSRSSFFPASSRWSLHSPSARSPRSPRAAALLALAAVGAASFAVSLWLTAANEPWAFFSLPTRAWELAAGGLVALSVPELRRISPVVSAALGWIGLGWILLSVVALSPTTPFPGTAAILPVGGAVALVAAGCREPKAAKHSRQVRSQLNATGLLGLSPFQGAGRVSYTWYLWHWPFVVLVPALVGHALPLDGRLLAVGLGLLAAVATTLLVEEPLRRAPWLGLPRGGLSLVGASSVAVVLSVVVAGAALPETIGVGQVARTALRVPTDQASAAGPTVAESEAQSVTSQVQQIVKLSAEETRVPANLQPSLWHAYTDEAPPFYDGCFDSFLATAVHPCGYGDLVSTRSIVLFGDSHALMWFPALENIAAGQGFRLVAAAKATCPPLDVPVFSPDLHEWYTQCSLWRQAEVARMAQLHPAVVVLGFSREYGVQNDRVLVNGPSWLAGLSEMIGTLEAIGAKVVVLGDVPYPSGSVPECLSAHPGRASACLIPDSPPAVNAAGIETEARAVTASGAAYIDTRPWFCAGGTCDAVVENMLVYRDDNHITSTYAKWLTPVIQAELALATEGTIAPPSLETTTAPGAGGSGSGGEVASGRS
jgi:peptidoglycan/LPS O-acetylase OafA/YrhL